MKRFLEVKFKKLTPEAVLPKKKHAQDACFDFTFTNVQYDYLLDEYVYGTGLACETDEVVSLFLHPRSSIHKTDYFLTNSVGVVDCATYRGEIRATFKHRDSLDTRMLIEAIHIYTNRNWFWRIFGSSVDKIKQRLLAEFYEDPLKYAPYQAGERGMQGYFTHITPTEMIEVETLSTTDRGEGGFGSTGNM